MRWKDIFNKKYMQISLYVIITAVIIYILSLIATYSHIIFWVVMDKISWFIKVIKPITFGFAFAYLMDPIVSFFERKYKKVKLPKFLRKLKAPRTWAAVASIVLIVLAASALVSLLVFSVTDQLRFANFDDIVRLGEEYVNSFDAFYKSLLKKLSELDIQSDEIEQYVKNATNHILNIITRFASSAIESITNISGYMTTIIFSFIIGFYFMIDGRMFMAYIKKVNMALLSEKRSKKNLDMIHDLDRVFSGYIRGQLADAFLMVIIISIVLSITGVKFAIVIGIFSGICNLIPYFGPIVAYISTTFVCLISGDIRTWLISMIALIIIQSIDGNFIGPKLLSRSIKIHPLIIIISLIFGSAVGGFMGMLLAVPIGAYIKLVFMRFIERRLKHKEKLQKENNFYNKNKKP